MTKFDPMLAQDKDKDEQFAEYADEHGLWKALEKFEIGDREEWLRLQKMMIAR